jgi:hypothetical protein
VCKSRWKHNCYYNVAVSSTELSVMLTLQAEIFPRDSLQSFMNACHVKQRQLVNQVTNYKIYIVKVLVLENHRQHPTHYVCSCNVAMLQCCNVAI